MYPYLETLLSSGVCFHVHGKRCALARLGNIKLQWPHSEAARKAEGILLPSHPTLFSPFFPSLFPSSPPPFFFRGE